MIIENITFRYHRNNALSWLENVASAFRNTLCPHCYPLRFSIVDFQEDRFTIEATVLNYNKIHKYAVALEKVEIYHPRSKQLQSQPFTVVQIIPTGVRCEFGGYAGDATPVTNLLAAAADFVVTHPNAVNASELNEMAENILYVEGKSLDDFLLGHLALLPVICNRIGTFVDPTGKDYLDSVINTLNAARAVKGIECDRYVVLNRELGVRIAWSETGCAVGTIVDAEAILEAVEALQKQGMDAIGGVSVIHGVTEEMFTKYLHDEIPNPSGGVEAIITHLISKVFRLPTAHAPLPYYQAIKGRHTENPRAAAEFISIPHYYCVLKGLARAPRLLPLSSLEPLPGPSLTVNNVGAIVVPASCMGGIPALVAEFSDIPLITVRENTTVLNLTNQKMNMHNVIEVATYLEACGVVLALRNGISLDSLRRPLGGVQQISL